MITDEERLQMLESEYWQTPPFARATDLQQINVLRQGLGLPTVDERLRPITATPPPASLLVKPQAAASTPLDDAPALYAAYVQRSTELAPHREYAERVASASAGAGRTPVKPLATMGPNGGPLLCDVCHKPIILEGGRYNGMTADHAWAAYQGQDKDSWRSYIAGGMVIDLETNGTLRVYHGYPGRDSHYCCQQASKARQHAQDAFVPDPHRLAKAERLRAYLRVTFPDRSPDDRDRLLEDVMETLFWFDPGLGVNRP